MTRKLLLAAPAALLVVLTLALAVGAAQANRLRLSATSFSMRWRELYFAKGVGSEEGSVARCPLTLSGSFHSTTLSKVSGSLVGYVTSADMATCSQGSATLLRANLPWHVTYTGFLGTLPNITGVRVGVIGFSVSIFSPVLFRACLMRTTTLEPLGLALSREVGSGALTTVTVGMEHSINTDCGLLWAVGGSSTGTIENGAARSVTVTLI
jgi:hypothetical protein